MTYKGPITHPVVKSVVKCMVITRLNKWFGIEFYCVSTDRVSDLEICLHVSFANQLAHNQRLQVSG